MLRRRSSTRRFVHSSASDALPSENPSHAHRPISQFGDGIISMIDCTVKVDKKEDPKGDRVLLTFECVSRCSFHDVFSRSHVCSGKFLKYATW